MVQHFQTIIVENMQPFWVSHTSTITIIEPHLFVVFMYLLCGIYVSIVWVTQELEPKGYYFTGFPTLHLLHSKDYFLCHFQYMCCGIHPLHHRAYIFLQPTCRFLFVSGVNIWCPRVVYAYLCLCLCVL